MRIADRPHFCSNLFQNSCGLKWEPYEVVQEMYGGDWTKLPSALECLECLSDVVEAQGKDHLRGETSVMIGPGYIFQVCDMLFTNFHAPRTTLMLLVSAFAASTSHAAASRSLEEEGEISVRKISQGRKKVLMAYERAVKHGGFRFLSYDDSCLFARFDDLASSALQDCTDPFVA